MTRSWLLDLPDEMLSAICDETDQSSLMPLAMACRCFNRIAGHGYLHLVKYDPFSTYISVRADTRYGGLSFRTLGNISSILGGMSKVTSIFCTFSESESEMLPEIYVLTSVLQRFNFHFLKILFICAQCSIHPFDKAFENLIRQVQRVRIDWFQICGTMPSFPVTHDSFIFQLPVNTSITTFSVHATSLLSQPYSKWLVEFLNSLTAVLFVSTS